MVRLDRAGILTVVLVGVAVASLGLVAGSIDSVAAGAGGQGPTNADTERESDAGERFDVSVSGSGGGDGTTGDGISLAFCIGALRNPLVVFGLVGGLGALTAGIYRRANAATAGLCLSGILPVAMLGYFMLTNCPGSGGGGDALLSGTGVLSDAGGASAPPIPPALVGVALVGAVGVAGALLYTLSGDDESTELTDDTDEAEGADFARAAGEAADRIAETEADVDNAVYEAWLEMTGLVAIDDPVTAAPRDFADRAIAAGLDPDDVAELTTLFTDVRYGGKRADDREDRALVVLRNIEREYGVDGDGSDDGADEPDGSDGTDDLGGAA